jgi:hypothetical protein
MRLHDATPRLHRPHGGFRWTQRTGSSRDLRRPGLPLQARDGKEHSVPMGTACCSDMPPRGLQVELFRLLKHRENKCVAEVDVHSTRRPAVGVARSARRNYEYICDTRQTGEQSRTQIVDAAGGLRVRV